MRIGNYRIGSQTFLFVKCCKTDSKFLDTFCTKEYYCHCAVTIFSESSNSGFFTLVTNLFECINSARTNIEVSYDFDPFNIALF